MNERSMGQGQSQVVQMMQMLHKCCEQLDNEIELLKERLESVLGIPEPSEIEECEGETRVLVGLAQQMKERVANIQGACRGISDIRQRLEL